MRNPVYRSTVTVTVLALEEYRHDYAASEDLEHATVAKTLGERLDMLALDINGGPSLGVLTQSSWKLVPDDEVEAACKAMGNDGTYFDVDEKALRMFEELEAAVDRQIEATRLRGLMHAVGGESRLSDSKESDEGQRSEVGGKPPDCVR